MNKSVVPVGVGIVALAAGAVIFATNQDLTTFDGCGPSGIAKTAIEVSGNPLKNRWKSPDKIDPAITLDALIHAKAEAPINQDSGASVTGWIVEVKPGGVESCNCGSSVDLDTHIYLCENRADKSKQGIVVEVTPRTRSENQAWTQAYLKTLVGKPVKITGWVFDDLEHRPNSEADKPGNSRNWRASCWEIHPVTGIEVLGEI